MNRRHGAESDAPYPHPVVSSPPSSQGPSPRSPHIHHASSGSPRLSPTQRLRHLRSPIASCSGSGSSSSKVCPWCLPMSLPLTQLYSSRDGFLEAAPPLRWVLPSIPRPLPLLLRALCSLLVPSRPVVAPNITLSLPRQVCEHRLQLHPRPRKQTLHLISQAPRKSRRLRHPGTSSFRPGPVSEHG